MMKKAADILAGFLDTAQLEKAQQYNSFFRSWRTIVGIDIASHTRVHEIEGWKLIVQADHPGWAQKIEWKKRTILQEIRKRYPELGIRDLRIWIVDKLSEADHDPPATRDAGAGEPVKAGEPVGTGEPAGTSEEDGGKRELMEHLNSLGSLIKEADKKRRH